MSLIEQLETDIIKAMKNKDKETLSVLRMVKGAMQLEHINNKKELNDEIAIDVISKQIKTRNESIKEFEKGSRLDLADQTKQEVAILQQYLPQQFTEEEIDTILNEVFDMVNPSGPSDMGRIMKEVTPRVKGKADMGVVSSKIKERLQA